MRHTWRCQKCFRYLADIENTSEINSVTQRTVCPRCKSENKITLTLTTVIVSCGFSRKYTSNLKKSKNIEAPSTKELLVEKIGKEICLSVKCIRAKEQKS